MAERDLSVLLDGGSFFEGPRWHEGAWWVSDFYREVVLRVDVDGSCDLVMEVPGEPSGLGWMPDGSLLVVSKKDRKLLRRQPDRTVSVHAELAEFCGGDLNDMVVDIAGRAYVGNFGFDLMNGGDPAPASLALVDSDGTARIAAEGLVFPNGALITPDGGTLIVAETAAARFTAWAIDQDTGELSDQRVWAQVAPAPELGPLVETLSQLRFAPDGCALDAEGHIWAADALGGRCARVAPGTGEIVEEIPGPEGLGVFACMLGGEDGRTLLLCCAPDFDEHTRRTRREALLVTCTVDVPHAGLP
ncbi:MAG: SMP-30/gluconolactonase/LRE family protein [Solirubrobacteraceae bacterium]